jgi:hypothetical protein
LSMSTPIIIAFPTRLIPEVSRLRLLMDAESGLPNNKSFSVMCEGETLHIPQRIYRPILSESEFASLGPVDQSIAACWFTRHHDGHVRERFLRSLRAFDSSWVIAYVVALCGEYVAELLKYIWERRELFDAAVLGRWLHDNPKYYLLTRARVASYWDCYYRSWSPRFQNYVGNQLIVFFEECLRKHSC